MGFPAFKKNMRKGLIIVGILVVAPLLLKAQKGGESTYSFLGLTNSARVAALGGRWYPW